MGLRLLTACVLFGTVFAQSGEIMNNAQILNVTRPQSEQDALVATQNAYDSTLATMSRRRHFFCVDRDTFTTADGVLVQFNTFEQNPDNVLSIWLQYPLLAYLDVHRKNVLMEAIVRVLNDGGATPTVDMSNLCLGTYDTYSLTTFNEGPVIRIYGSTAFTGTNMADRFRTNLVRIYDSANNLVVNYPEQSSRVIALNLEFLDMFDRANALHPGASQSDGVDPTVYPVIIGIYPGNVTAAGVQPEYSFASNPNPINYYLQVGDYIFLVIGSILLAVVLFLIIFGYCIHPFL